MRRTRFFISGIISLAAFALLGSCGEEKKGEQQIDSSAMAMLEGLWVNDDDESVTFKVKGDTLYYPDEGVLPASFRIYGDTLYVDGAVPMKYFIEKQSANIFQFRNQNGESIKLVKGNEKEFANAFKHDEARFDDEIIQKLLKRDTVVTAADKRYHCYVQINPTTYKVLKNDYNQEGVGVSRVYYDNIIHLSVYEGARKVYSSDLRKQDFVKYVPAEVMRQSILSDVVYDHCGAEGVVFHAVLRIPDSASGYLVYITISPEGTKTLSQP